MSGPWEIWNRIMTVVGTIATVGGFVIAIVTLVSPGTVSTQLQAIADSVDQNASKIAADTGEISSNTAAISRRIADLADSQDPVKQAEYRLLVAGYSIDLDGFWLAALANDPRAQDFALVGIRPTALQVAQKYGSLAGDEFSISVLGAWIASAGPGAATAELLAASIEMERFLQQSDDVADLWNRVCATAERPDSVVDALWRAYSHNCSDKSKWLETNIRIADQSSSYNLGRYLRDKPFTK